MCCFNFFLIMLKLFNKPKEKSVSQIIEEIHESFYTEVNKLLESANIQSSLATDKQDIIDKRNRLVALGFYSSSEVKEAESEIQRLQTLERENSQKKELIEAINYFSFKYPAYKFITEESVKKICQKYGLVYGIIDHYIGTVPDKNLKHMEYFKISEDDECYLFKEYYYGNRIEEELINIKEYRHLFKFNRNIAFSKLPLEIAAPVTDFNLESHEVKNFKISKTPIPDPVVLKPVIFNTQKYYLIVTAWGDEASDELVLNSNHN